MKKTISVIIPVYNVQEYLSKCIDSVIGQTYENLEILLVNDGSTDQSGEICERYARRDPRIQVIHQENKGLAAARNAGIEIATGAYIGFVDSDDWIDLDMYEFLYSLLHEYQADLAICRLRKILSTGAVDGSTDQLLVTDGLTAFKKMVLQTRTYPLDMGVCNKLYKKELLTELRFPVGRLTEDIYFTPKVLYRCRKCVYQDTAKYNYLKERPGSIMNAEISSKKVFDELEGYLEIEHFFIEKNLKEHALIIKEHYLTALLIFHHQIADSQLKDRADILTTLRKDLYRSTEKKARRTLSWKTKMKVYLFALSPAFYQSIREVAETTRIMQRRLRRNILRF